MQLTTGQKATLKTWLDANAGSLDDEQAAAALNVPDAGNYKAWRSSLGLHDYVEQPGLDSASAVTTFAGGGGTGSLIDRSQGERDVFIRVLWNTSLQSKPYLANVRIMIFDIFSGAAALAQQNRKHFWARGQRVVTVGEKLFVAATVGGPRHDASNGNSPAGQTGARGSWTNPDTLGTGADGQPIEGRFTAQIVSEARQP